MKTLIILLALFVSQLSLAFENDLRAICKRPGTNELFIGGEFNSVFVIDEKTGETIRQFKIEGGLEDMQFSPEGDHLITTIRNKAYFVDPETGESKRTFEGGNFILLENSPYFIDISWYGHKSAKVYSTKDGEMVYQHKNESAPWYAGMSPDFTELFIVYREEDIKKEKSLVVEPTAPLDGFNVFNKAYVEQESDKMGSRFVVVDISSKSIKLDVMMPYSVGISYGTNMSKFGNDYYIVGWDVFLRIDAEGRSHPISCADATFSYATNHSQDGKSIMVLSTKEGFIYNCEKESFYQLKLKENNEFAYSCDVSEVDGSFITLAKDYSVISVSQTGTLINRMKINRSSENGFGVYYYNGFNKKDDRDKEAAIINEQLKKVGLDPIDLETDPGKSDFLLGIFSTEEEAKSFADALDANGLEYITKIAPAD